MSDHDLAMQNAQDIAALRENCKSAHKRIDENDRVTEGIYKLAASVETMAVQIKTLAQQMEAAVERVEAVQKAQGERIGKLEAAPGQKWDKFTWAIIAAAVSALVAFIAGKVLP